MCILCVGGWVVVAQNNRILLLVCLRRTGLGRGAIAIGNNVARGSTN